MGGWMETTGECGRDGSGGTGSLMRRQELRGVIGCRGSKRMGLKVWRFRSCRMEVRNEWEEAGCKGHKWI